MHILKFFSPRSLVKGEWSLKLKCPPHSPDLNPLDYFFLAEVQTKVYEGRDQPFKDQAELKARIRQVWHSASNNATV